MNSLRPRPSPRTSNDTDPTRKACGRQPTTAFEAVRSLSPRLRRCELLSRPESYAKLSLVMKYRTVLETRHYRTPRSSLRSPPSRRTRSRPATRSLPQTETTKSKEIPPGQGAHNGHQSHPTTVPNSACS